MLKPIALALTLTLGLAACSGGAQWQTAYTQLTPAQTAGWRVADVTVAVPSSLTTSEVNTYTPDFDIVWHGEPAGDRRAQVAAIVDAGVTRGAQVLRGGKPVRIAVTVQQFHALTPITRQTDFSNAGVHNMKFTAQVFDARTGAPLTEPQLIQADVAGLTGTAAKAAEAKGYTQRDEIVTHLAAVTQNWLGYGADPRTQFSRQGR